MSRNDRITPEGTRDLLFEECEAVKRLERALGGLFASRGFQEVRTPGLEFLDLFTKPGAVFPQESMYTLTDRKGRLMVMRPDSTMPIARLASTRLRGAPLPLRLYYNQPVYRAGSRLNGRSDEIMQTGVELIGCGGPRADLEVLALAADALRACGGRFRLEVGHVGVFRTLAGALPVPDSVREELRTLTETKNYPVLHDRLASIGTPEAALLDRLPRMFGGEEVLAEAERLFRENAEIMALLSGLRGLYEDLCAVVDPDCILLDLGLVNPSSYYTGVVFTGYLEGRGEQVLSGGRYDRLLGAFDGPDSPAGRAAAREAIGFAVDVDAAARLHLSTVELSAPSLLVHAQPGFYAHALRLCREMADAGRACEYSVFDTPEEAVRYARQRGIPTVASVGAQTAYYDTEEEAQNE